VQREAKTPSSSSSCKSRHMIFTTTPTIHISLRSLYVSLDEGRDWIPSMKMYMTHERSRVKVEEVVCIILMCHPHTYTTLPSVLLVLNLLNLLPYDLRVIPPNLLLTMLSVVKGTRVFIRIPMGRTEVASTSTWEAQDSELNLALRTSVLGLLLHFHGLCRGFLWWRLRRHQLVRDRRFHRT